MLSAKIPPTSLVNVEMQMVWDGLFHPLTWVMSAIGVAMLWHTGKEQEAMVMGWGVPNVV